MNFLAHAYLSFNQQPILVGNMISDFVKGKKQYLYTRDIQNGIKLHRAIDRFTDEHPVTKQMGTFFKADYGLYASVFTDIVYDYFLANDKKKFASESLLEKFSLETYSLLEKDFDIYPVSFQRSFGYMKKQNWLYQYRLTSGIEKSFAGVSFRAKYMDESQTAFDIFTRQLHVFETCYEEFFPALQAHAVYTLQEILNTD